MKTLSSTHIPHALSFPLEVPASDSFAFPTCLSPSVHGPYNQPSHTFIQFFIATVTTFPIFIN